MDNFRIYIPCIYVNPYFLPDSNTPLSKPYRIKIIVKERDFPVIEEVRHNNVDRFSGFGELYDQSRPVTPPVVTEILTTYLRNKPHTIVDVGCWMLDVVQVCPHSYGWMNTPATYQRCRFG